MSSNSIRRTSHLSFSQKFKQFNLTFSSNAKSSKYSHSARTHESHRNEVYFWFENTPLRSKYLFSYSFGLRCCLISILSEFWGPTKTIYRKRFTVAMVSERLEHYLMPTMEIELTCLRSHALSLSPIRTGALSLCAVAGTDWRGNGFTQRVSSSIACERALARRVWIGIGKESEKWMLLPE